MKVLSLKEKAHKHCSNNKEEIKKSEKCGCFYCLAICESFKIKDYVDGNKTALCPKCGIDSVIGDKSGFPVTKEFLKKMKKYWF